MEMLEGRKGRRCYPRYTADLKKMDAAIHCERHEEARELILKLNQSAMSSRDYVNYNMAVLSGLRGNTTIWRIRNSAEHI